MNRCKCIFTLILVTVASAGVVFAGANLEPDTETWLGSLQGPPIYTLSSTDARAALSDIQSSSKVETEPADIEDRELAVGPFGKTRVRIIRPPGVKQPLPAVIYLHGGGWVLGDTKTHDRLVREIANGVRAEVIFVDFDRAPEARYPIAIEEAYTVTQLVAQQPPDFNVIPGKLAVAGDGAGGNMATVMTLLAKNRGGARICAQVLFYPVTDANFQTDSYQQFANGPWLTKAAMQGFWDAYLPDHEIRKHPTASPLEASVEELHGLPPALVITAENDVLRDEGEAYARKLEQAGVRVTSVRCPGTIHDFVMLNPLAKTVEARNANRLACDVLCNAFEAEKPAEPVNGAAP